MLACSASFILAGCFNKDNKQPHRQVSAQDGPAWLVSYNSTCAGEDATECPGFYGFTLDAAGNYQVGPGPAGQHKKGRISDEDLQMLTDSISTILQSTMQSSELTCNTLEAYVGQNQTITIQTKYDQARPVVQTGDKGFCSATEFEPSNSFYKTIKTLAEQYYPSPFPDACEDAIVAAEGLHPQFQFCATDTDCGYLTPGFEVVPPSTMQYIITDDCSRLKPLIVANIGAIVSGQEILINALQNAQGVCREKLVKYDCTGVSGFQATDGAPLCIQNTCRVNPTTAP